VSIGDGFSITITSEIPRHEARLYVFLTVLFAILTLAAIAVLIWGIRTYRFLSEPGSTAKTILIMLVSILVLFFVSYFFFSRVELG
jgi:predicted permease